MLIGPPPSTRLGTLGGAGGFDGDRQPLRPSVLPRRVQIAALDVLAADPAFVGGVRCCAQAYYMRIFLGVFGVFLTFLFCMR